MPSDRCQFRRARRVAPQGLLCAAALQAGGNGEARKTLITTAAVATDEVATEEEEYGSQFTAGGSVSDDEDALVTWDAQDKSDELSVCAQPPPLALRGVHVGRLEHSRAVGPP